MAISVKVISSRDVKAPTSGSALYIVVEERDRHVTLLHPVTLSKFDITAEDYRTGVIAECYPVNSSGYKFDPVTVALLLEKTMRLFAKSGKQYSAHTVRRCIAELRGVPLDEIAVVKDVARVSSRTGFAVKSEKRPGVIDAIVEMLEKGASLDEMVKGLSEKFPDRKSDGMKTTVRCQLNRLPGKLNRKILNSEDKKRGKVFKFA